MSSKSDILQGIANVKNIYYSERACRNSNDVNAQVDLPSFLPGYELIGGIPIAGKPLEISVVAPTPEACETECYTRGSECDAWTFIPGEDQVDRVDENPVVQTIEGKYCIFPFRYKGKKYYDCTTDDSENGKAWCATTIDSKGKVVPGKWGDCRNDGCKTIQNKNCIIPFNYKGKQYFKCTTDDSENGKAWCATKVNSEGNVIFGNWGDCQNGCPIGSIARTARSIENTCRLKNGIIEGNTCLNTISARRKNSKAISGFNCYLGGGDDRKCWSINGVFPDATCPFRFEAAGADTDGTSHTSGTVRNCQFQYLAMK